MVIDNFYDNPDEVFNSIHDGGYQSAYEGQDKFDSQIGFRKKYKNAENDESSNIDDKWLTSKLVYKPDWIRKKFEDIVKQKICKNHWYETGSEWNGRLLVKKENADSDFIFHNHNNIDRGIWDSNDVGRGWAAVVFLNKNNPPEQGFFTARPDNILNPEFDNDLFLKKGKYKIDMNINNVYNRCVITDGELFHAGALGCGDDINSARIVQTFFMRLENEDTTS